MTTKCEIISKGRCQVVTDAEIEELRVADVSWYAYCQKRLTANHSDALAALIAKKRNWPTLTGTCCSRGWCPSSS